MSDKLILSTADYGIFGTMLAISAVIGVYFQIFGGDRKTNVDYLLAGKNMAILPVSFSLMATFMSATTLMGIPAEMYHFGTNMTFMNIGFLLGPIIASVVFLPVYFNTGVSTAYEYLEIRFGRSTRRILSGIFLLSNLLFNGVSLYAPALALSAVTNLSMWTSVISIGTVCTFYCTIGGMKAVLWTDVFQSILMYVCLFTIIIKGCLDLGSLQGIFSSAYDGGRILLPTFEMNFSLRYTMWSVFLQGMIITTNGYAGNQIQVQRLLTLKNIKRSRIAALLSIPMLISFQLLCCFCGLIFYVHYKSCDPLTSPNHPIDFPDQLMPYYISSTMGQYPGLPGLCIAGIFSASLSTISSAVNSMAAVTYEDLIHPIWPNRKRSVFITKIMSLIYGIMSVIVTFLAASLGNLIQASVLIAGMLSGPALGVFMMAVLTTAANEIGVNIGVLTSFFLAGCITFIPNNRYYPDLPVQNNCSLEANHSVQNSSVSMIDKMQNLPDNFPISYMWITPFSLVVCLIVGYISSWIASYFYDHEGNHKILGDSS